MFIDILGYGACFPHPYRLHHVM